MSETGTVIRPVHTYSIVARDATTGELGVAVQSHWFSVGSVVPWAKAGVGAVATQSFANVSFGLRGLRFLEDGKTAQDAVETLIRSDEGREGRQLAIVDARGQVAVYTGARCIAEAGHLTGEQFSVQANMMLNDRVWPAMAETFARSAGPLADRLVAALAAAQRAGGDVRGKQSAALLVVRAQATGRPWDDTVVELRVEDHTEPVQELQRLLQVHRAYEFMDQGDHHMEGDDVQGALAAYGSAESLFPQNPEMQFWHAVALANKGLVTQSLPIFRQVFRRDGNWAVLTARLPAAGLLTVSEQELQSILSLSRQ
jgi:uncharacterized Ntn-hydrolase superfamily protein